jgi:Zn-dependent protease
MVVWRVTGSPVWAAITHFGAVVNLFNLIPVWQLDGSRGIQTLDRAQIWMLALLSAAMWMMVSDGMLLLLALVLGFRAFTRRGEAPPSDWTGFTQFAGLIAVLALLCRIPLPSKL